MRRVFVITILLLGLAACGGPTSPSLDCSAYYYQYQDNVPYYVWVCPKSESFPQCSLYPYQPYDNSQVVVCSK